MVKPENIISREPKYCNGRHVTMYTIRCEKCGKQFKRMTVTPNTVPLCAQCKYEREQERARQANAEKVRVIHCSKCILHGLCMTEQIFEEAGIEDGYCAQGERRPE